MGIRKCPVCRIELKEIEKRGVLIDRCPKCLGIWLEKGELDKIVEKRKKFYERIYKEWPSPIPGAVAPGPLFDDELEAFIGED